MQVIKWSVKLVCSWWVIHWSELRPAHEDSNDTDGDNDEEAAATAVDAALGPPTTLKPAKVSSECIYYLRTCLFTVSRKERILRKIC